MVFSILLLLLWGSFSFGSMYNVEDWFLSAASHGLLSCCEMLGKVLVPLGFEFLVAPSLGNQEITRSNKQDSKRNVGEIKRDVSWAVSFLLTRYTKRRIQYCRTRPCESQRL